jgi:uncharacterized protein DUF4394
MHGRPVATTGASDSRAANPSARRTGARTLAYSPPMPKPAVLAVAVLALAATLSLAAPAGAEKLVALTTDNRILTFDSATPATVATRTIGGLGTFQQARGIDHRPADGIVYLLAATDGSAANSVAYTYALDVDTGYAGFVGETAAAVAGWGDVAAGTDFNPTADRLRAVNVNDESFRVNPNTGVLAGNDTDLTPAATTALIGAAYDRNVAGAAATTLFAIDRIDSQLARVGGVDAIPSPNGGVVTDVGALGLTLSAGADAGLDISGTTGTAFAAMTSSADGLTRLYTINLATGAATAVGLIGSGTAEISGLTVVPPPAPGPAGPVGATGATGPQGPAGSKGDAGSALAAAIALDRFSARARRSLSVRIVVTLRSSVTLQLRKGTKVVKRVTKTVKAGRTTLKLTKLPKAGSYTLRLVAKAGSTTVTDTARLTIRR